jgi:hypothetical protein
VSARVATGSSWGHGVALGATVSHPPSSGASGSLPSHGRVFEAFRPAWASWIPGTAPCDPTNAAVSASASAWASLQIPRSCGVIRPRGSTAVASATTRPAPPTAREPRWTWCHGVATPSSSSTEYWHIGETIRRFGIVVPRRSSGVKRSGGIVGECAPADKAMPGGKR